MRGAGWCDQGNIVHATDTNGLVVITQLRPIFVVFTLPEQDVGIISRKMAQGPVTTLAMDRDNKTVLDTGKLAVIDNQIDSTTGTIKLKAAFPNQDLRLCPGQFVNPRVLIETTNGLVVPESVIQRGPEGEYVFTIARQETNARVKLTPVTVGRMQDGWALIADGLTNGQEVVVDGQYRLEDVRSKVSVQDGDHPGGSPGGPGGATGAGRAAEATTRPAKCRRAIPRPKKRAREHLRAIHPASHCDVAAHGGCAADGIPRLSTVADLGVAAGRFSDHPGRGPISRGQPGSDGVLGDDAVGAAIRAD